MFVVLKNTLILRIHNFTLSFDIYLVFLFSSLIMILLIYSKCMLVYWYRAYLMCQTVCFNEVLFQTALFYVKSNEPLKHQFHDHIKSEIYYITGINAFEHAPPDEWFQMSAVLRVSLGNFLFFAIFAVMMIGIKDQNDRRDAWHHGGWVAKIAVWAVLIVLMFCVPNIVITIYGKLVSLIIHVTLFSSTTLRDDHSALAKN